ncbi:MAG TPA: hypothetical protein VK612_13085 [Pyrinomonadaceae bacterium]|nr:hypothetical protein [Pyrinomonadaceae bacterium]
MAKPEQTPAKTTTAIARKNFMAVLVAGDLLENGKDFGGSRRYFLFKQILNRLGIP